MRLLISTPDEMDDFVAIACGDLSRRPIRAGKNLKIALDGYALSAYFQVSEQARNVEAFGDLLQISVDCDFDGRVL
jgi:hypothetical protein